MEGQDQCVPHLCGTFTMFRRHLSEDVSDEDGSAEMLPQLRVHIVLKMSERRRRPSLDEGFTIGTVQSQVGVVQQLALVSGKPKHKRVCAKPVEEAPT